MARLFTLLVVLVLLGIASRGSAQVLVIQQNIDRSFNCCWGSINYFPPPSPVPPRYHGPSLYANYGQSRLYGRVLALPGGMSPPGPAALDRFTIARFDTPAPQRPVAAPARPQRYAHPSYQTNRQSRYAHH